MPTELLLMPLPESPELLQVLEDCESCERICVHVALTQSLEQGGDHVEPSHFRLLMSCASMCSTTAMSIAGGFDTQEELCRLCASVCRACAESCRRIGDVEDCVEACERCARSCDRLLGRPLVADSFPADEGPSLGRQ